MSKVTICQNCRARHLKCDNEASTCSPCAKNDLRCIRERNVRFRHHTDSSSRGEFEWKDTQKWCRLNARRLKFIDETQELVSVYDLENDSDVLSPPSTKRRRVTPPSRSFTNSLTQQVSNATLLPDLTTSISADSDEEPQPAQMPSPRRLRNRVLDINAVISSEPILPPIQDLIPFTPDSPLMHHMQIESPSVLRDFAIPESPVSTLPLLSPHSATLPSPALSRVLSYGVHGPAEPQNKALQYPLHNRQEAELIRHFVLNLSSAFDLCDQDRHFELVVPYRAAGCPILRNALCAVSAKHLSLTSQHDSSLADKYLQECLKYLIPALDDATAVQDENLLAAVIVLRFLEEIHGDPSSRVDGEVESHLLGLHAFITAQSQHPTLRPGGLRQAAYWVGLRQENRMAFVHQRAVSPAFLSFRVDLDASPPTDSTWANRLVLHCAHVLNYCFGTDVPHSPSARPPRSCPSTYADLVSYTDHWFAHRPATFHPVYHRPRSPTAPAPAAAVFPETWLLSDAAVHSMQYYHLIRILLISHDPRVPLLGPARKTAAKARDEEIREHVWSVCAIARGRARNHGSFVGASMAMIGAKERFLRRVEQDALLGMLEGSQEWGWCTADAQRCLREAWGMD